jgi:hypothetical protein
MKFMEKWQLDMIRMQREGNIWMGGTAYSSTFWPASAVTCIDISSVTRSTSGKQKNKSWLNCVWSEHESCFMSSWNTADFCARSGTLMLPASFHCFTTGTPVARTLVFRLFLKLECCFRTAYIDDCFQLPSWKILTWLHSECLMW